MPGGSRRRGPRTCAWELQHPRSAPRHRHGEGGWLGWRERRGKGRRKGGRDKGKEEGRDAQERDLQPLLLQYLKNPSPSPSSRLGGEAPTAVGAAELRRLQHLSPVSNNSPKQGVGQASAVPLQFPRPLSRHSASPEQSGCRCLPRTALPAVNLHGLLLSRGNAEPPQHPAAGIPSTPRRAPSHPSASPAGFLGCPPTRWLQEAAVTVPVHPPAAWFTITPLLHPLLPRLKLDPSRPKLDPSRPKLDPSRPLPLP